MHQRAPSHVSAKQWCRLKILGSVCVYVLLSAVASAQDESNAVVTPSDAVLCVDVFQIDA